MLAVEDLSFRYASAPRPAVDGLRFAIREGEVFGFLGPNGAGKSTTQRILIGLLRGYRGTVTVFGSDLRGLGSEYYERIGVSFELPNHYLKLTGRENLTYFASLYSGATRPAGELLERVALERDADTPVSQYSKGMKSRLTVARALLNDPDLLFLDEPTAGLDPVNARRIKDLIRGERRAGRAIFLTTHDMSVADELCDRVAFLVDGRIALTDSPRSLKLEHGRRLVRVEYRDGGELRGRDFPLARLADDAGFLALLRERTVETIHSQEATLEAVFIEVTGRSLA